VGTEKSQVNGATPDLPFADRRQAGQVLASRLTHYADRPDVLVLALPRGGVPVAYEVAATLGADLDIFLVRKLGLPGHPEYAMGAIATGGVQVLNEEAIGWYHIPQDVVTAVVASEKLELQRREAAYRGGRTATPIAGKVIVIVDDGLATGASMRAAVTAVRQLQPSRIVVAVPVGAPSTCRDLQELADEVVCARTPEPFSAVGQWYRDFSQTGDDEVQALLGEHKKVRGQDQG
jgi:predicted phosphoribosyltransferase